MTPSAEQSLIGLMYHTMLQGDVSATEFFVLESGACDVFVQKAHDLAPRKVLTYGAGRWGNVTYCYSDHVLETIDVAMLRAR